MPWHPAEAWSSMGVLNWPVTHTRGEGGGLWGRSGGHGCREAGPGGSQTCLCPPLQENHKLRDQNDDLNGQILSLSLYEAKNLFATQTKAQSLAAEIDTASRDEVRCPHALIVECGPLPVSPAPGQEKQARAWPPVSPHLQ